MDARHRSVAEIMITNHTGNRQLECLKRWTSLLVLRDILRCKQIQWEFSSMPVNGKWKGNNGFKIHWFIIARNSHLDMLLEFSNLIETKVHHAQITCFRHFKIIDYLSIKRHKAKPHTLNTNYKKVDENYSLVMCGCVLHASEHFITHLRGITWSCSWKTIFKQRSRDKLHHSAGDCNLAHSSVDSQRALSYLLQKEMGLELWWWVQTLIMSGVFFFGNQG